MEKSIKTSRILLRIHGSILCLAVTVLLTTGWISYLTGEGVFGSVLLDEPIGFIGLSQAYALMATVGLALWMGSYTHIPSRLHFIGIAAHSFPLFANFYFWDQIDFYGIPHSGIGFHVAMMLLELIGLLIHRKRR